MFDRQKDQENEDQQSDKGTLFFAASKGKVVEQMGQVIFICCSGQCFENRSFALILLEENLYFFFKGLSHFANDVA